MNYTPDDVLVERVEKNVRNICGFVVSLTNGKAICLTEAHNLMQELLVVFSAIQPADTLTDRIAKMHDVKRAEIDHISPCMVNVEAVDDGEDILWGFIEIRVKEIIFDHLFPSRKWNKPLTWVA